MFKEKLKNSWTKNNSLICVGLDPDLQQLPQCLQKYDDAIFQFNKALIDATADLVCAYKLQIAYYSAQTAEIQLQRTIDYLRERYPSIPVILDAKRNDMGDVAIMYAREAFDRYRVDAVTVNPYLGTDSLRPFLDRQGKGIIIICLTSNHAGQDIQRISTASSNVFSLIAEKAIADWNYNSNVLLVVGATNTLEMNQLRKVVGEMTFLVPGIGYQGGDLEAAVINGCNSAGTGLILSASRSVMYASSAPDFADCARNKVLGYRTRANKARGLETLI